MMNSAPWRPTAVSGYPSIIAGGWLLPAGAHIFQKYCYCSFTGYFKETFPNFLDNAAYYDKKFFFFSFLAFFSSANLSEYPPLVVAGGWCLITAVSAKHNSVSVVREREPERALLPGCGVCQHQLQTIYRWTQLHTWTCHTVHSTVNRTDLPKPFSLKNEVIDISLHCY